MIKWYGDRVIDKYEQKEKIFLHAVGAAMVNQMGETAHKDTGTLANSMNYKIMGEPGSGFSGKWGGGNPPETAKVSSPGERHVVRAGSALVYAGPQEGHNGWCRKALDYSRSAIRAIAAKVFKI